MPSVKWGSWSGECKVCSGAEYYNPHEPAFMTVQILWMVQIPQYCPSHWLYLNCAFLINSGAVIFVFPAWTASALLANFSLSLLSLSIPLSASSLWTHSSLSDPHHGDRNWNGCGEWTRVRASDPVNDGTPHIADIQEWITYKSLGPRAPPPVPAMPTLHSPFHCESERMLNKATQSQRIEIPACMKTILILRVHPSLRHYSRK